MKQLELKENYKKLVRNLKSEAKAQGKRLRNEDIAKELGYNRSYFSTLIGERGIITEDHIKDLMLHFPREEQTIAQASGKQLDPKDEIINLLKDQVQLLKDQVKLLKENNSNSEVIEMYLKKIIVYEQVNYLSLLEHRQALEQGPIEAIKRNMDTLLADKMNNL